MKKQKHYWAWKSKKGGYSIVRPTKWEALEDPPHWGDAGLIRANGWKLVKVKITEVKK